MRAPKWLAIGLAVLVTPGLARAQAETGSWSVDVIGGAQLFAESSALETGPVVGLEALYQVTSRLAIGPAVDFVRSNTDGSFFVAALDFGADSTRVFEVGQRINALQYGGQVRFDLIPQSKFNPYVVGGAGAYTLYLETQSNDGFQRVTHLMFQGGGGFRYAVSEAAGIQFEVRDMIYTDFDRQDLNPIRPEHYNCPVNYASINECRFPEAARSDLPDPQDTLHNIRFSLGLTYIPGRGR